MSYNLRSRKKAEPEEPEVPAVVLESVKGESTDNSESSEEYQTLLKKRGAGEGKMKKMFTRAVSGSIMVITFYAILTAGHLYVAAFVIGLQVLLFKELTSVRYDFVKAKDVPLFRTLQWGWFTISMFYTYGQQIIAFAQQNNLLRDLKEIPFEQQRMLQQYHTWVTFSGYVVLFLITVLSLKKGSYRYQMSQLTWTVISICLIVFQMKFIFSNIMSGLFWFTLPCCLVIQNDVMAYFVGFSCGRKYIQRPFLQLSPNKTWEGFIGGGILTMVFAYFFPLFFMSDWWICPTTTLEFFPQPLSCTPHPVFQLTSYETSDALQTYLGFNSIFEVYPIQLHSLVLAVFASVVAPFGGFLASAIKRAYGVKDFDSLIPGHGGVMDRMDCQMIMALGTAMHYQTFIQPAVASAASVLAVISTLSAEEQKTVYESLQQSLGQ